MKSVCLLHVSIIFASGFATVYVDGQDGDDHEPSLKPLCPPDQTYYRECKPDCKNTCKNYDNPGVRCPCGGPGCFCREGLVLDMNGKCVRPEQCKDKEFPTCSGENEEYQSCRSPCPPPTCDNYDDGIVCIQICLEEYGGCDCAGGYVRNKEGKCVLPSECPKEKCSGKNEIYLSCGTACPDTCDNYDDKNRPCTLQCVQGCFCKNGYVRDNNGNCILPSNCPTRGLCWRKNEEYRRCKVECPRTCENYDQDVACTKDCAPGCYCRKGYVRDVNGNCILPSQCPPRVQCNTNEEFSQCGGWCDPSCQSKPPILCPAICAPGCVCKKGFVRIIDAIYGVKAPCIREHMCPFFISP